MMGNKVHTTNEILTEELKYLICENPKNRNYLLSPQQRSFRRRTSKKNLSLHKTHT